MFDEELGSAMPGVCFPEKRDNTCSSSVFFRPIAHFVHRRRSTFGNVLEFASREFLKNSSRVSS